MDLRNYEHNADWRKRQLSIFCNYTAFCDNYGKAVYQLIVIIMKLFSLCCYCSYVTLTFDIWTQFLMKKKRSEETQTLRAGCSKADPEIVLPGGAVKI